MDPFTTLGLERRFGLDLKQAEARHLELSRALHPDKHASKSPAERREALSRAVEVNEAWRLVRDPIKRAEAVLSLAGFAGQIGETREPKPSGAFLMEVMEAREALDEAKDSKDPARVAKIVDEAKKAFSEAELTLGRAVDGPDPASAIPLLGRLRYAARFLEEAIRAEDELAGF